MVLGAQFLWVDGLSGPESRLSTRNVLSSLHQMLGQIWAVTCSLYLIWGSSPDTFSIWEGTS